MNDIALTAEEARAELEVPQAVLRRSGFAAAAPLFSADLASAGDLAEAARVVTSHGRRLWTEAVRQETADDRPLYWARLTLSARLRSWRPAFDLGDEERRSLLTRLEHASRGHEDLVFPPDDRLLRVIVTGFDPDRLDEDIRRSNPSGASALALDGATFDISGYTAVVRTAVFPVRWRDFSDGIVERTLFPQYTAPAAAVDAVITLGEGSKAEFGLDAYSGAWRGDAPDNERHHAPGPIPIPGDLPPPFLRPQWSPSTLPRQAIVERAGGRFPIHQITEVTEIPAGHEAPVVRAQGPTSGSQARAGGNYFSNEIAYRNTRLRDATGRTIPAGHIHTPTLELGAENPVALSCRPFERDRADILDQLRAIIAVALEG
ncbi:pyroglutamyl peptidase [Allosalinactinospora lopnorensis]|uniref:pyroglutamyl peptidase n=1 Tax=Allosalinactinospora lopnorensis TaxID=1352348 RepID=UPI000623BA4D|nr:pyroglutamyl peptidase [Allosalinactinospora lopnorensis]